MATIRLAEDAEHAKGGHAATIARDARSATYVTALEPVAYFLPFAISMALLMASFT